MTPNKKIIIYTDLDGSLLDHQTYDYTESLPALKAAQAEQIPIIFCSSKTRAEVEPLRRRLDVHDPYIIENGGAIISPAGYFKPLIYEGFANKDQIISLGVSYRKLIEKLDELQRVFPKQVLGFNEMSAQEVAQDCGLSLEEAQRAKQREFDEPFRLLNVNAGTEARLMAMINRLGLSCSRGGRYFHLHGRNDKGLAVRILNWVFKKTGTDPYTIGIGDSLNDLPMLKSVDYPILIKKNNGRFDERVRKSLPGVHLSNKAGPNGWREAVLNILAIKRSNKKENDNIQSALKGG